MNLKLITTYFSLLCFLFIFSSCNQFREEQRSNNIDADSPIKIQLGIEKEQGKSSGGKRTPNYTDIDSPIEAQLEIEKKQGEIIAKITFTNMSK